MDKFSQARPKPSEGYKPDPEEFAAWCESRVTRWVATAWKTMADAEQQYWIENSWGSGEADPIKLAAARASARAYLSMLEANWSDYDGIISRHSQGAATP